MSPMPDSIDPLIDSLHFLYIILQFIQWSLICIFSYFFTHFTTDPTFSKFLSPKSLFWFPFSLYNRDLNIRKNNKEKASWLPHHNHTPITSIHAVNTSPPYPIHKSIISSIPSSSVTSVPTKSFTWSTSKRPITLNCVTKAVDAVHLLSLPFLKTKWPKPNCIFLKPSIKPWNCQN